MTNPNKKVTYRVRLRFQKHGIMRFVGHLDMMRFFQKAIRRAGLPVAYSNGFHPHQIMSFALPLGIGITSDGEYMDLELSEDIPGKEALDCLNAEMAGGVRVMSWNRLPDSAKKAMAAVEAAEYRVELEVFSPLDWWEAIRSFYKESDAIIILKKTKKSERFLDLKPLIHDFCVEEETNDKVSFYIRLSAGSTDNIKPDLVFSHFLETHDLTDTAKISRIHRLDLLGKDETGRFISLGDVKSSGNT